MIVPSLSCPSKVSVSKHSSVTETESQRMKRNWSRVAYVYHVNNYLLSTYWDPAEDNPNPCPYGVNILVRVNKLLYILMLGTMGLKERDRG